MDVCSESLVGWAGLSPWVSTAREVDEDDAERPNVVLLGVVGFYAVEYTALAFGTQVEGRSAVTEVSGGPKDAKAGDLPAKIGGSALGRS